MRIKEVLNDEGKFVYEEIDGRLVLARIIRHDNKYYEMGIKTITDEAEGISVTYWYEYSDNGPVQEKKTSYLSNFVDTDPDGEG